MEAQLQTLQQRLQHIYEVDVDHCVNDFLITDRMYARRFVEGGREVDEQLLVRQSEDNIDLALFLDADLIARLAADDPIASLHDGNMADFCTALEGVSHFLYLIWNASQDRSVSCFELEMQSEIDKYVILFTLISQQRNSVPGELHEWLFAEPVFASDLDAAELDRYRDANHYAAKYCFYLEQRYLRLRDHRGGNLLNELRRFYRLSVGDKIRRIEGHA